jgi:hypothetical protein
LLVLGASLLSLGVAPAAHAESPLPSSTIPSPSLGSSLRVFSPALAVTDGVDVAALRTGAPVARPLEEQMQLLFEAFLASSPTGVAEVVQVQVRYSYEITPGSGLRVHVPVLLTPWTPFSVPGDWSPGVPCQLPADRALVCQLSGAIELWFKNYSPELDDAELTFDTEALPKGAAESAAPEMRAQDLKLRVSDITNL